MSDDAVRLITEGEMRDIEQWARINKKSKLLDFLADLPRDIQFPRRVLIGSWQGHDRYYAGRTTTSAVTSDIFFLDDSYTYDPHADDLTTHSKKREERFDADFWRSRTSGLRLEAEKVCLAAHLGGCSDQIIAAHSIQRSELLPLCRQGNHLYGFKFGGRVDHRKFGVPESIGVNLATTFAGVCNRHDTEIFRPIETEPFTSTRRELFLYHYRACLFGHYLRTYEFKRVERIYDELKQSGRELEFHELRHHIEANNADQTEVAEEKSRCDSAFISGDFNTMLLSAWESDSQPPLAGTMIFGPHKDFRGNRLQHPHAQQRLEWMTLTVTPKQGKSLVVFGANSPHRSAKKLVESFENIPEEERMHILLTFCLCYMELFALVPAFWDRLDDEQKEAVIRTHQARYFPRRLVTLSTDRLKKIRISD